MALPWWDWTVDAVVPDAYAATTIGGQPNPLAGSKAVVPSATPPINRKTRRAAGQTPLAQLPTADDVAQVLSQTDWASFSDLAESLHDEVHVWVGADMSDITTAAFDPIFFAHHCMIDRLWYLWQVQNGNGGIPEALLDLELIPFGKRLRDVLDAQLLGYEYADTALDIPVPGGGP